LRSEEQERHVHPLIVAMTLMFLQIGHAGAGAPDPLTSACDTSLSLSPFGDCPFAVVVRNQYGHPVQYSTVVIEFGACDVQLGTVQNLGFYAENIPGASRITGVTGNFGKVVFYIRGMGSCSGAPAPGSQNPIRVYADGVLLRSYASTAQGCAILDVKAMTWGRVRSLYR
jgi:hypothetical protein